MTSANENVTENADMTPKAPMALKVLVVALGIAIVALLGLIIWKVMAGDHKKKAPPQVTAERGSLVGGIEVQGLAPQTLQGVLYQTDFSDLILRRPEGGQLVSYTPNGLEIILHFKMADGTDQLLIINRATGKESRITIP